MDTISTTGEYVTVAVNLKTVCDACVDKGERTAVGEHARLCIDIIGVSCEKAMSVVLSHN